MSITLISYATAADARTPNRAGIRKMLNKVPEVTLYFWIIKILATTVGETAADFLNTNLKLGLTGTTFIMTGILVAVLVFQFRLRRYLPGVYWLAVVLISVVGTLITDNLTDNFGVALPTTTVAFAIALAATFGVSSPSPWAPRRATSSPRSSLSDTGSRPWSSPLPSPSSTSRTSASS